ncbi:MAG: hypothetical protein ACYCZA_07545 [Thiobacillus sp.]
MRLIPTLLFVAMTVGAWNYLSSRPIGHADGTLAPKVPVQVDRSGLPSFSVGGYQIKPAAEFSLQARVLSTEPYYMGREADLSPVDLALGWGPMSDSAVLNRLQISQNSRFYFYRWSDQPPIEPSEIVEYSANMHMIPASDEIKKRLSKVRAGQVVTLSGYLVRVQAPDGWHWNSSMTRSDSGNGACELVWVKSLTVR